MRCHRSWILPQVAGLNFLKADFLLQKKVHIVGYLLSHIPCFFSLNLSEIDKLVSCFQKNSISVPKYNNLTNS